MAEVDEAVVDEEGGVADVVVVAEVRCTTSFHLFLLSYSREWVYLFKFISLVDISFFFLSFT